MKNLRSIDGPPPEECLAVEDVAVIEDIGARGDGAAVYRPSAFYFRRALNRAATLPEAVVIGMTAVRELENLKEWIRENFGCEPYKRFILISEVDEKNAADAKAAFGP